MHEGGIQGVNKRRQGPLGVVLEADKHRMWDAFLPSPTTRKENPSMLDQRAFSRVFCLLFCMYIKEMPSSRSGSENRLWNF